MSYKKRGQAGWCGSKEAKGKMYKERNYAKGEIKQALTEIEAGEDYRYTHQGKKVKNEKSRLENSIAWYERIMADNKMRNYFSWCGDGWLIKGLRKAKLKWQEKFGDKDEELRRCNYCRKDTPTLEEDCTICDMSKPNK